SRRNPPMLFRRQPCATAERTQHRARAGGCGRSLPHPFFQRRRRAGGCPGSLLWNEVLAVTKSTLLRRLGVCLIPHVDPHIFVLGAFSDPAKNVIGRVFWFVSRPSDKLCLVIELIDVSTSCSAILRGKLLGQSNFVSSFRKVSSLP